MVAQPAVGVEGPVVVSRVAEAGEAVGEVSAGQEEAVASGAASEVAVGVRRGVAEVVSRVVAVGAVVVAGFNLLHSQHALQFRKWAWALYNYVVLCSTGRY